MDNQAKEERPTKAERRHALMAFTAIMFAMSVVGEMDYRDAVAAEQIKNNQVIAGASK